MFMLAVSAGAYGSEHSLLEAIRHNDIPAALDLLKRGKADVMEKLPDGATALHWAIYQNNLELVHQLLRAGADVNAADQDGVTPLWIASYNGNPEAARMLLQAGADPDAALRSGETPLMTAAENGNLLIVQYLLMTKADVNSTEIQRGQTALMWAVAEDHADIAAALIAGGADIMQKSKAGYSALHFASQNHSLGSVKVLLSMDAEINDVTSDKMSPLLLAAAGGHDALTRYLLEMGADPAARDYKGFTALHYAVMKRNMSGSVRSLLENGADPNAQILYTGAKHELVPVPDLPFLESPTRIVDAAAKSGTFPIGATPLYLAAQQRNAPAMRTLAKYGADPHVTNTETVYFMGGSGRRVNFIAKTTPLMGAAGMDRVAANWVEYPDELEKQALEAVKVAVELGSNVNAANEYGLTALHAAAFIGADDIIEFLIQSGADPNARDMFGQTPVTIARQIITEGLGNHFDVRPRRESPGTLSLLLRLGATPFAESGIKERGPD